VACLAAAVFSCRKVEAPASQAAEVRVAPAVESDDGARQSRPAGGGTVVIWLGLDGLDWEILDRLTAEGRMPNWKRLVSEGYSSKITSFMPPLSPVVWTTVATGVGPDVHRILDFQEVDPKTGEKVPISGRSRAVPAIWNLASAAGKKVGVVGWWATHPAEEVNGFFISDHACPILFERPPLSGVTFPPALGPGVAQTVSRDGRVTASDLSRFVDVPPEEIARALEGHEGIENPVVALSRILSATRVYQRVARDLYDKTLPDLMMLYFEGTDEIAHVFAPDTPPKLSCVSDQDLARYQRAVPTYYATVDQMLGQWMRRAEEDHATLIVHSDHGFKWGEDRPCQRSSLNWSTAAYWHRLDGVFAAWGERVVPGKGAAKPSMFDPPVTVLALLGIPADRSMSGRPIAAAFRGLPTLPRKDLFSQVVVRRVSAGEMSPAAASEYSKKLLALGYLSGKEAAPLPASGGERPGMTEGASNNLGVYERDTVKNLTAARQAFEKSLALRPDYHSPMFNLAVLYRLQGQIPRAEQWLFRSLAAGHADPEGTILQWTAFYRQEGKPAAALSLAERGAREYPRSEVCARELGFARFRAKDCVGAYGAVARFEATTSNPNTLNALGLFETCRGKLDSAVRLFERSLALKPDQPAVVQSLNVVKRNISPKQSGEKGTE
jgi:tetratricopeptide (TPR) repeat protein